MSNTKATAPPEGVPPRKSYFEQQRELLVRDISVGMEHVLQNINRLNRSLEGVIAVGNEFSSVEALWSHFENVMAKDTGADAGKQEGAEVGDEDNGATTGLSDAGSKR